MESESAAAPAAAGETTAPSNVAEVPTDEPAVVTDGDHPETRTSFPDEPVNATEISAQPSDVPNGKNTMDGDTGIQSPKSADDASAPIADAETEAAPTSPPDTAPDEQESSRPASETAATVPVSSTDAVVTVAPSTSDSPIPTAISPAPSEEQESEEAKLEKLLAEQEAAEGKPDSDEQMALVDMYYTRLRDVVGSELRKAAGGIKEPSTKKKRGKKQQRAGSARPGSSRALPQKTARKKKGALFDPPRFAIVKHRIKLPKGGIGGDLTRCLMLLDGWGDQKAVNLQDPNTKMTALHFAAFKGRGPIVDILLTKRADPNRQDNYGRTALYIAASGGHHDCVMHLLSANANMHMTNVFGNTAFHAAVRNDRREVLELIVAQGADPTPENIRKQIPVVLARTEETKQFVLHLLRETEARKTRRQQKGLSDYENLKEYKERTLKKAQSTRRVGSAAKTRPQPSRPQSRV